MNDVLYAFALTAFAGLSTGIGSCIAYFAKGTNKKFLSISLGFSAGVMIYVSMIEIFFKAQGFLVAELGLKMGSWITVASFFGGIILIAFIDKVVPEKENPHELKEVDYDTPVTKKQQALYRMGVITALAIIIHNIPEGMATFILALKDPTIAVPIAVAIAIHNIPEGIAVFVPIYYSTGSKKKAFIYSLLSGLSEPVGALIGWLILMPIMSDVVFGIMFAGVAGIMVFISLDGLLPAAREYGERHLAIYGLFGGMLIMAISLLLFL